MPCIPKSCKPTFLPLEKKVYVGVNLIPFKDNKTSVVSEPPRRTATHGGRVTLQSSNAPLPREACSLLVQQRTCAAGTDGTEAQRGLSHLGEESHCRDLHIGNLDSGRDGGASSTAGQTDLLAVLDEIR